jgi:hypothetical protein
MGYRHWGEWPDQTIIRMGRPSVSPRGRPAPDRLTRQSHHLTLERKSGLRFSRKAAAPSFDSSVW